MPQASSTNRLSNFNNDRCVSTPHINVTGFIDDTYRDNRGTRLEGRIQTRSNKGSSSIDAQLREDFAKIKIAVIEWGEIACSGVHTVDVINRKHNSLCMQIEHKISEVLLKRGDYSLVGELGSLKDRLIGIRKEAKLIARSLQQHEGIVPLGETGSRDYSARNNIVENVFFDDPEDRRYIRQRKEGSILRSNAVRSNDDGSSVVACGPETNGLSPARLAASEVPQTDNDHEQRTMDIDLSQSLTEIIASVHGIQRDPQLGINVISTHTDAWMHAMKSRQQNYEIQLNGFQKNLVTMSIVLQGAESVYEDLQGDVESLKTNSEEVWERLKIDEARMNNLDRFVTRVDNKVNGNFETVNEWFANLAARPNQTEIPREIVDSLREIINDSSPGAEVNRMRNEIMELRESMTTSRYATEGLRGLVVDLSDQVSNVPPTQMLRDESLILREDFNSESSRRECEIVRKGIERMEKQLRQLIRSEIRMDSVDISLIKKYKTVDIPSIQSAIGNIQKSLQRYVKFSGMDSSYCDEIDKLLDDAEIWCLNVDTLYNKEEIHSINTSKGDSNDVGIFLDNAKVTVYEFLEAAEIAYLGWVNSVQKANRMYNRHLSEEIKSKLINMSDSYAEMKQWLILNYGGVSRIINDVINDLSRKNKPTSTNSLGKFTFYAHISGVLQRLERLSKVDEISPIELETCLYSRATLSSLSLILPKETYSDWISEMTKAGLDYKNPMGTVAYSVFKNLCIVERNKSEGARGAEKIHSPKTKPRSPKPQISPRPKPKSIHQVSEEWR